MKYEERDRKLIGNRRNISYAQKMDFSKLGIETIYFNQSGLNAKFCALDQKRLRLNVQIFEIITDFTTRRCKYSEWKSHKNC